MSRRLAEGMQGGTHTDAAPAVDAVVVPGGYAPDMMRRHEAMVRLVREAAQQGKVFMAELPNPVFRLSDLPFLDDGRAEKLDLYLPNGPERKDRPAVVFIHGGGFTGGDKAEQRSSSVSADLARAGYVVVSCNYVLGAKTKEGVWPRNIADCRAAVRWVRGHAAELGVHPEKIAVAGGSAGGYLALMVGLSDDRTGPGGDPQASVSARVAAVIDMYGVVNFSKHGKGDVVGATAAPSVPLGRRLADRYGNMAVMRGAFLLQAAGVLLRQDGHALLQRALQVALGVAQLLRHLRQMPKQKQEYFLLHVVSSN